MKTRLYLVRKTANHQQRFLLFSYNFFKPKRNKSEHFLVRPLLSLTRFDLKKVCNSWKIPLFPDQSNQKLKYQRNRIRKQILPTLRFFFNPQIDTTLFQFIEIINSEQEYMDFITARVVKQVQHKTQTRMGLEKSLFAILPIALKRKVIKHFLEKVLKKSTRFFDIERFLQQTSISSSLTNHENIKKKQKKNKFIGKRYQNLLQLFQKSEKRSNLYKKGKQRKKYKQISFFSFDFLFVFFFYKIIKKEQENPAPCFFFI